MNRKYDILLATSIVESGLDIQAVNTLIVEDAEEFGLAQLYQLRGRVGRERLKAYCYLFFSQKDLTEDAGKRLSALKSFSSLGSGFQLAVRDLEIRGAGNLLGPQQHGFINAVGIDLYGQLLLEEIKKQRGEKAEKPKREALVELPVSAYIPEEYLPNEMERIAFYKRLVSASREELKEIQAETEDRCGKMPEPVKNLFEVTSLRFLANDKGVSKIIKIPGLIEIMFRPETVLSKKHVNKLLKDYSKKLTFIPGPPYGVKIKFSKEEDIISWIKNFLSNLG